MNLQTDQLEYVEIDGKQELSIVRTNLMNQLGYSGYCGNGLPRREPGGCSWPRTRWNGRQFVCPECGWTSWYPDDFINRYKAKWGL
jgi:hypothetical protein